MSSPSQLAAAIDRLVVLFGTALPGVQIADGLQVSSQYVGDWAVVGGDGVIGEEEDAGRGSSDWQGLGAMTRQESIDVTCAIGSSTGNAETSMKPRRDRVWQMLAAVEVALRSDPGLNNFVTGGGAAVTDTALRYPANVQGLAAVVLFTVNLPVRI